MCSTAVRAKSSPGFTLMELVVVMAILGIVLSFAGLQVRGWLEGSRLDSATRMLIGYVTFLEGEAMRQHQSLSFHLDVDTGQYWVSKETEEDASVEVQGELLGRRALPPGITFEDGQIIGEPTISEGELVVEFDPRGLRDGFILHLRSEEAEQRTLLRRPWSQVFETYDGYET